MCVHTHTHLHTPLLRFCYMGRYCFGDTPKGSFTDELRASKCDAASGHLAVQGDHIRDNCLGNFQLYEGGEKADEVGH